MQRHMKAVNECGDTWHHEMHSYHSACGQCGGRHQHPEKKCDPKVNWWDKIKHACTDLSCRT